MYAIIVRDQNDSEVFSLGGCMSIEIVNLDDSNRELFSICLEDWSDIAREAGSRRADWVRKMQEKGLRAKLARNDEGQYIGMIQYLPIEQSIIAGEGLYFIPCIWVHGYKQGVGNQQKKGVGKALLAAAEEDVRSLDAQGMAAWGLILPFWMKAAWYRKQGFRKADRDGISQLVWKPFTEEAQAPRWAGKGKYRHEPVAGKVCVTAFCNGSCMACNLTTERAKRAAAEFGDKVVYREIDTSNSRAVRKWCETDAVYIDGKPAQTGQPPSYEKIFKKIEKRVRKLR